ncbi:hypothetical protein HMI54_008474 [Coelomomyces lativittatus]|nr:hypothetical protein HMI55_006265 [Coelomomyces lativittatus]KAJ1513680.1 hypothetical protein HMI56_001966 [Coelomomyces lativittatus]KAJ1516719.1 hypothetical protein HMI54_008474 [Coelomomyces lativittatus]
MSAPSFEKLRPIRDALESTSQKSSNSASNSTSTNVSSSFSSSSHNLNSSASSQYHHHPYPTSGSGSSRESISTQLSGVMPPFLFNTTTPSQLQKPSTLNSTSPLHIATQHPQQRSLISSSSPSVPTFPSRSLPPAPISSPAPNSPRMPPGPPSSQLPSRHYFSSSSTSPSPHSPVNPTNPSARPMSTSSAYRRSVLHPPPPPPVPDAKLVYTAPQGGRTFFMLTREVTSIGRKEDNHIVLSCAKISKHHALIERTEHAYFLRDRNSSNGVKLNDVYVSQVTPLNDGDRIHIGTVTLHFQFVQSSPNQTPSHTMDHKDHLKLVTILPSERKYEETVSIRAELDDTSTTDFPSVLQIFDIETLKEDYEKLRLAYELSKLSYYTSDINDHLTKMLELMFSVLPVDRGVVLLVDKATSLLVTHMVKLREGKGYEGREILLSSTILQRVYTTRKCLITSDACEDPDLGKSQSIARGQIRSVICVPIVAHDEVLGILHLDSRDRINAFLEKDLSLVQTILNQTALQIENSFLFAQLQTEIRVTEQLQRFLPPQVISRMVKKEEVIRKGGCEMNGTIIFADIRGFTNLSEKSSPSEVFDLLNDYFERLVQIVFKYNGVVDKFIGDELMAVFGTLDDPTADLTPSVLNSVHAALEFKTAIALMNEERVKQHQLPIAIGVGLNTGRLMSGFMGSSQRLEYTCIGDTVNLASRICGYASADQVLLSEETAKYIKGRIDVRFVGARQFKGKEKETRVYEAIGITEDGLMENASEVSGPASSSLTLGHTHY